MSEPPSPTTSHRRFSQPMWSRRISNGGTDSSPRREEYPQIRKSSGAEDPDVVIAKVNISKIQQLKKLNQNCPKFTSIMYTNCITDFQQILNFWTYFQIMLLGDSGVGKTCLLVRFRDGHFLSGNFISTVGIDFRVSGDVCFSITRDSDALGLFFNPSLINQFWGSVVIVNYVSE